MDTRIAERGPMPLFQADVQLYRARLFGDRGALKEARGLIEKHGYGRRLEELADAEALTPCPPLRRGRSVTSKVYQALQRRVAPRCG